MTELFRELPHDTGGRGLAARRAAMCVLAALVALSLLNVFGQQPSTSRAAAGAATLVVSAPRTVRGGLLFQGRIQVVANRTVTDPQIVLARGWFEGMQVNTIEPAATDEAPADGRRVALTYGRLEPGDVMTVWIQLQVNPDNPGRRPLDVELRDGGRPVAAVGHDITILP
jgi:hypothetical protein